MSKVKSMTNISNVAVVVQTKEGTLHLPPRASLGNVEVYNLSEVKKQCKVSENLNEITREGKRARING